ncbi:MAG: GNAT family N-acetyltransferase [Deltaproteobacteria bacterium]|nr:GNAT family N-acetyltransferase [Deltaproteobacteria bacterium]
MRISPAGADDLAKIFFLEQAIEGNSAASLETLRNRRQMFGPGFLAAREDDHIVGYVESCLWDLSVPEFDSRADFFACHHRSGGKVLYIIFLGVEQNSRRQGVGSTLLGSVMAVARKHGVHKIQVVSRQHLISLYSGQGFTTVQKIPGFLPGADDFYLLEYKFF